MKFLTKKDALNPEEFAEKKEEYKNLAK